LRRRSARGSRRRRPSPRCHPSSVSKGSRGRRAPSSRPCCSSPKWSTPLPKLAFQRAQPSVSWKKSAFLAALLLKPKVVDAAPEAGISTRTAFRFLRDPAFREALSRHRDAATAHGLAIASEWFGQLVHLALEHAMSTDTYVGPPATRFLLGLVLEHAGTIDVADRLARLEKPPASVLRLAPASAPKSDTARGGGRK
jgi:hypothetical protein